MADLSDTWPNTVNARALLALAEADYGDDGEDERDGEVEEAKPQDGLLEGDPEEGVDAHDCAPSRIPY